MRHRSLVAQDGATPLLGPPPQGGGGAAGRSARKTKNRTLYGSSGRYASFNPAPRSPRKAIPLAVS